MNTKQYDYIENKLLCYCFPLEGEIIVPVSLQIILIHQPTRGEITSKITI